MIRLSGKVQLKFAVQASKGSVCFILWEHAIIGQSVFLPLWEGRNQLSGITNGKQSNCDELGLIRGKGRPTFSQGTAGVSHWKCEIIVFLMSLAS